MKTFRLGKYVEAGEVANVPGRVPRGGPVGGPSTVGPRRPLREPRGPAVRPPQPKPRRG